MCEGSLRGNLARFLLLVLPEKTRERGSARGEAARLPCPGQGAIAIRASRRKSPVATWLALGKNRAMSAVLAASTWSMTPDAHAARSYSRHAPGPRDQSNPKRLNSEAKPESVAR